MITAENLRVTYKNAQKPALKGISFFIDQGRIFGFLGPSGAGKSTTQKVLTRLLPNYEGNITINGKNLKKWSGDFYNHIGVGFELPNHYGKLTAIENLRFFAGFYDKKTKNPTDLLSMVDLEKDKDTRVEFFSKGMKMRLNFIRALIHDPDILFFDEPTSGLDPGNARKIKDIILDLKAKGKTIFLTTHNMHDADELSDTVAFITNGNISTIDEPKKLKQAYGKRQLKIEYENGKLVTDEFNLDELKENQKFLDIIQSKKIISMHTEEASLDDIFIKVTGSSLT